MLEIDPALCSPETDVFGVRVTGTSPVEICGITYVPGEPVLHRWSTDRITEFLREVVVDRRLVKPVTFYRGPEVCCPGEFRRPE